MLPPLTPRSLKQTGKLNSKILHLSTTSKAIHKKPRGRGKKQLRKKGCSTVVLYYGVFLCFLRHPAHSFQRKPRMWKWQGIFKECRVLTVNRILPDSHPFFNVGRCYLITEVHHKLGKLLHVDNVLWVLRISIDYLRTPNPAKGLIRVRNLNH